MVILVAVLRHGASQGHWFNEDGSKVLCTKKEHASSTFENLHKIIPSTKVVNVFNVAQGPYANPQSFLTIGRLPIGCAYDGLVTANGPGDIGLQGGFFVNPLRMATSIGVYCGAVIVLSKPMMRAQVLLTRFKYNSIRNVISQIGPFLRFISRHPRPDEVTMVG